MDFREGIVIGFGVGFLVCLVLTIAGALRVVA